MYKSNNAEISGVSLKSNQSRDMEEYVWSNYTTDINVGQFTMVECDILPVLLKKEKAICFKDIVSHLKGLVKRKNFFPIVLQFSSYCWYTQPPLLQPIVAFPWHDE